MFQTLMVLFVIVVVVAVCSYLLNKKDPCKLSAYFFKCYVFAIYLSAVVVKRMRIKAGLLVSGPPCWKLKSDRVWNHRLVSPYSTLNNCDSQYKT